MGEAPFIMASTLWVESDKVVTHKLLTTHFKQVERVAACSARLKSRDFLVFSKYLELQI